MLKVGDQIKMRDDSGYFVYGVVTGILSLGQVKVCFEDGFDLQVNSDDLILLSTSELSAWYNSKEGDKTIQREKSGKADLFTSIGKGVVEADLHIEKILTSTRGLQANEMLSIQLEQCAKIIENARKSKMYKIVLIHGEGDGKLRSAIKKFIASNYPDFKVQNADIIKYGNGATELTIR